jgi:tRNA A-37 threonylcarbamoyl transferase component Bud32
VEKSRFFNKIEIVDNYTIKKISTDKFKMKAEYLWYKNSYGFLKPAVYDFAEEDDCAYYTMEYIHGKSLASYFVHGQFGGNNTISKQQIDNIFGEFHTILRELIPSVDEVKYTGVTKMAIQSMYKDKTYERLAKTDIDLDKEYKINGKITPTIRQIIEDCPVYLSDKDIRPIHGDLCFSNIILDSVDNAMAPFVIDPRGYLPGNIITNIGDSNYDVAKLAHSVIGRYDQIKENYMFDVKKIDEYSYDYQIFTSSVKDYFEESFIRIFKDFDYYNIMIHLFLSMIPLHSDYPEHQEKMLVNALRLYLEREDFLKKCI